MFIFFNKQFVVSSQQKEPHETLACYKCIKWFCFNEDYITINQPFNLVCNGDICVHFVHHPQLGPSIRKQ